MYVTYEQENMETQLGHVFFVYDRYNERQKMMEGSPTLMEQQWPGISPPIDAAVFYDGSYITFNNNISFNIRLDTLNKPPVHQVVVFISTINLCAKSNKVRR